MDRVITGKNTSCMRENRVLMKTYRFVKTALKRVSKLQEVRLVMESGAIQNTFSVGSNCNKSPKQLAMEICIKKRRV